MPSAFISYAHEDQEFVLVLVERLQAQSLDIRYDQVALHIGDSLIQAISDEITEGDFLIAVVSPDSLESEWCKTELALAITQGINERRIKVLPVRFRGAEMPPMLQAIYRADGDRDDPETLARRLAAAIQAHLEGRDDTAAREAAEVEEEGGTPAHAEVSGDVVVAQIEEVAQRVWDVLEAWSRVWDGRGNALDIRDPQRRLRWALDVLPDRVHSALPLVRQLANAEWDELFADAELLQDVERDSSEEMLSVRTQVAQGLPVVRRWTIDADLGEVSAGSRDASAHLWQIARGDDTSRVVVYISGTALASVNDALPREVVEAKETNGRSVVSTLLSLDQPPREVMVSTAGISWPVPE